MCRALRQVVDRPRRPSARAVRYKQDRNGGRRDKEGLDPAHDERECPSNKENDMHRTMIATSTILLALATHAAAQDWPTRPMTLVVPFSAGGGVDVSARIQAQRMGELLGQTIIVENVGAAAGMAGGQRVAKAAPDGYTFLIGNTGTHAFNQSLYKKPLYNAATDFQPVGLVSESPRILVARKDLPVTNLKELITYIKANESKMQYGSAGVGSGTHLPCALFNQAIGANVTHVPYRGEGPVMQDLIGGRIDYMCATIQSGAAQSREGTVRGIAVMAEKRAPIIPDLATTGEQGLPGVEASVWNAFFLPKGTPDPIVRKLNKAMSDTVDDPTIRKRLEELGLEIVPPDHRSPEYLTKYLPQEIERWAKPIQAGGISAD
jgi:tripartite-type tricarboxylate transporter receptor subunit TctC